LEDQTEMKFRNNIFLLFLLFTTTGCQHLLRTAEVLPYKKKEIAYYTTISFPHMVRWNPLGVSFRIGLGKKYELDSYLSTFGWGSRLLYQILKEKSSIPATAVGLGLWGPSLNFYLITSKRVSRQSSLYAAYRKIISSPSFPKGFGGLYLGYEITLQKGNPIINLELYKSFMPGEFGDEQGEIPIPRVDRNLFGGFAVRWKW